MLAVDSEKKQRSNAIDINLYIITVHQTKTPLCSLVHQIGPAHSRLLLLLMEPSCMQNFDNKSTISLQQHMIAKSLGEGL